jgi:polysaccharide export outer membrane protein
MRVILQQAIISGACSRPDAVSVRRLAWRVLFAVVAALLGSTAAAQPDEYVLGAQDVLTITVFDQPKLSGKFSVEADGTISFPLIGRTKVGGLTVQAAERSLQKILADGFVNKPQVSIAVEQYRSQQIFVMGQVRQPGSLPFTGGMTLLEALARAGGANESAGSEAVVVRPPEGGTVTGPLLPGESGDSSHVSRINLDELEGGGSPAAISLEPGDTIYVPKAPTVFVVGQVARPGEYRIRSRTTLRQALALAGGVTERGSTRRISVIRVLDGRETQLSIKEHETVQPGDTIVVKERLF